MTKQVKSLYKKLQKKNFEERHPDFNSDDGKIHLLYLSPVLNERGYYRAILPALQLNRTGRYHTLFSSLHKCDFTKTFNDYDNPVDERLIEWAHYVILPMVSGDISDIIDSFSKVNDEVQFVMDLDSNLHVLPKEHPNASHISFDDKRQLLSNIAMVDLLTAPNEYLLDFYEALINKYHPDSDVLFALVPSLVSPDSFEKLPGEKLGEVIRIGIVTQYIYGEEGERFFDMLSKLNEIHKGKINWILIGSLPTSVSQSSADEIGITQPKPKGFLDYFAFLSRLELDAVLLPGSDNQFNAQLTPTELFEFAALSIPVVASNLPMFKRLIKHSHNGYLAENDSAWLDLIEELIADPKHFKKAGLNARKALYKRYGFTTENLRYYTELFI